jgi:hypothetical protein
LALLALLWYQMREPAAAATTSGPSKTAIAERTKTAEKSFAVAEQKIAEQKAALQPGKLDPAGDAYYMRFDRRVGGELSANAMQKCYHGGLSRQGRDAHINFEYDTIVNNGEVTFTAVRILESTLTDKALEACMVKEMLKTHFHDDELPDWKDTDRLTLTPERVLHKYIKDDSYVGPEAPPDTPR